MRKAAEIAGKQSHLILLAIIIIIASVVTPVFLSMSNISNIIVQQIPYHSLMAFGMTIAILTKGIDLSIGANMALSGCVAGYFITNGQILPGVALGLLTGVVIGLLNGIMITAIKVPPFIATYCMDWIVKGVAYVLMGGMTFSAFPDAFRSICTGDLFGVPNLLWILLLIFVLLVLLLFKTTYGRNIYMIGNNKEAAQLSGVNTDMIICSVYVLNGVLASIAGLLTIARMNAADAVYAEGWSIKLIAAVLIGGTPMLGGKGSVGRTLVGVISITIINNCLNLLNVSSLWQQFVIGMVIMLSIFVTLVSDKLSIWAVREVNKPSGRPRLDGGDAGS